MSRLAGASTIHEQQPITAMTRLRFSTAVFVSLAFAGSAHAASSAWQSMEGARLRLVTEDQAGPDGVLRGALEIRLLPGWKTYWREPGDTGVPPTLTIVEGKNVTGVSMHFPAPHRYKDEWSTWAGYSEPMAIALEFPIGDPAMPVAMETSAFLGICKDICIPVQMNFSLQADPRAPASEPLVEAAFAALPPPPRAGFSVTGARLNDGMLTIEANVPAGEALPDLFLAPGGGWMLDVPTLSKRDGDKLTFQAKVLSKPKAADGLSADFTLTSGDEAVSGQFSVP